MATPSRLEVEHLHRVMMRASSEAADLEKRVGEAQKKDGLGSLLKLWQDAAAGVDSAFSRARSALKKEGTPDSQIDRIEKRIKDIRARSVHFDLHEDLDACVESWKALGLDLAQLSGKQRDPLVQLLDRYRPQVDKATAGLSSALRSEGMLPQDYRELKTLREQRDHAREKYEQLRQKYLAAEKDWQAAEQQKAQADSGGAAQHTQHGKLPVIHTGGKGPVVVRLPNLHKPRHHEAPPEPAPVHGKAPHHRPHHKHEPPRPPPLHHAPPPPLPKPPQKPKHPGKPAPHKPLPAKPFPHRLGVIHPPRMLARHAPEKPSRAAKVTLEKIDRVGGYPEALDGIGRGAQSAHLYFRAENIDHALRITGTLSIQLGCGVRLDVAPSVQLFAATPNTPLRGKVSLGLASSGGRLGTLTAHGALEYAAAAAKTSAAQVASKLGFIGEKLRSAIADVLEDAAEKIFAHAHSPRPLPPYLHPRLPLHVPRQQVVEHQVGRFGQSLGQQIHHARAVRGGHEHKHTLHKILDHDHHHRATVASRLEETLSHLATAAHRTLTDKRAGEMRGQLARIDSILAKVRGKTGEELAAGAQEIGQILSQIGSLASLKGGAANISNFRKLIDERRAQLMKVLGQKGKAPGSEQGRHLPAAQRQGHNVLQDLRRHHPALDKLLKNASSSHLAQELAKIEKSALHALAGKQRAHAGKHPAQAGGMGTMSLTGLFHSLGGGHLAGFGGGNRPGGLGAMAGIGGALSKVLHKQLEHQVKHARPHELGKLLADLQKAPKGSPLHDVARHAEMRRQHHERATSRKGPPPSYLTATALLEAFQEHPKGKSFARHVAKGGALYHLCEAAQRGSGLPVGKMASHYLAARGSSPLYNTVQTFHSLVKEGHHPRTWGFSFRNLSSAVSGAIHSVSNTVSRATNAVTSTISSAANTVRSGISSVAHNASSFVPSRVRNLVTRAVGGVRGIASGAMANARQFVSSAAHHALDSYQHAGSMIWNAGKGAFHAVSGGISSGAHALWNAEKRVGQGIWGGIKGGFQSLGHLAQQGVHAAQSGMSWAQGKAFGALDWAKHKAQTGLEWVKKTGVVGAVGGMLKKGLSTVGSAANWMWKHSPLGIAVSKGWGMIKSSPAMQKIWSATKHYAGKAWEGIKKGYKATANFLQSPAGQLLVTGLSLAASFIPGGLVVKAIIGGAIGAISAISEGKDWKGVLAGAAGGALTGALPFLKIGPLAKIGIGALQGGIGAIASGGNWKDALKGAVGGAVDNFSPGALKSLGKIKGISAAGKLLSGGKLSKAEKAFMQGSKAAGPLRALEKLVSRPGVRGSLAKLEKMGGKAIKGGIWVSGKAAKAQGVLDKVVGVGDQVHGALSQVHDLAPGLSSFLGDNAAGHFVGKLGDWAGEGDDKLSKALEYGHSASDKLSQYRGYLDKGLGYAGVKDPAKAYEKQMARKGLAKGKKGSLEEVARQKLERHKEKHPELHLEGGTASKHKGGGLDAALPSKKPHTALEKAIVKGKELKKKGLEVAQGVHDGLGKVHGFVGKGIEATDKVQHGLEQASALAKQGAGLFGDDSDVGKFLLHASTRADAVHEHIGMGLDAAKDFNDKVGRVHDWTEKIHGVHKEGEGPHAHGKRGKKTPLEEAAHLEGKKGDHEDHKKKSPHDTGKPQIKTTTETEEQKKARYSRAWTRLGTVAVDVNMFEKRYGKTMPKIREMMAKGQTQQASLELMGLGSNCDAVSKSIKEALELSKGNEKYEKQARFFADWHKEMKAKLHAAIADTKGLGNDTQISGFGISEATHPDIFQNTREIFAIQAKVIAFGDALSDTDAHDHVKKVLADARKAKADLQALKSKYRKDKKAKDFLTAGGQQDKLIDASIAKLEKALKGESHEPGKPGPVDPHKKPEPQKKKPADLMKTVEHGLKAIDKYRKKAVRTGRKIDHGLTQIEHVLGKGIKIGKKVDSGLGKIAGLADQVSGFLGEDTPLGQLAQEAGKDAGAGHDKLHRVLDAASKGKSFLKTGHELFHQGLQIAAGHHEKRVRAIHGEPGKPKLPEHLHHLSPHGPRAPRELDQVIGDTKKLVHGGEKLWKDGKHTVHDAETMWKHGKYAAHDARHFGHDASHMWGDIKKMVHGDHKHHLFEEGKHLWGEGAKLWGEGKHLVEEGKDVFHEGKHVVQDVSHLIHKGKDWVTSNLHKLHLGGAFEQAKKAWHIIPEWLKGILGGGGSAGDGGITEADCAVVVQGAQGLVKIFGKAVASAIKDIEKLMKDGDTKGAGNRVEGVSATSEQTRLEVTHAVTMTAKYPALHRQALEASKHYLEIRGHFFKFVQTLHGLAGQTTELQGVDASKYPDLAEIATDIGSLQIKVDALGELKDADTPMQEQVKELKKEASEIGQKLQKAKAGHKDDKAAAEVIDGLSGKLRAIEAQLGSHGSKGNVQQGDAALGVEGEKKSPRRRPARNHDLHGPIHVHGVRGVRGDMDIHDYQEVDPASADTWIGSGEGVKLFSDVFGAFLPAEGALVHGGGGHALINGHGTGPIPDEHPEHGPHGHHGGRKRKGKGGFLGRIGSFFGSLHKRVSGFFHGLFENLHSFADTIGGWAEKGASLLGQGMHFVEMGMHGLSAVEKAAEKVQGIAGRAESFLSKMGLGNAAGFAHRIGGAAGWVDQEAKTVHGGLKTADRWMGKGKKIAGQVEGGAHQASGIFDQAEHGRLGSLLKLFKASSSGDGIDGKLAPEKMRLGSVLDDPQRLDVSTMHRMEMYLGGDFAGVRLHTGPGAAEITRRFNAEAVTVKDHIFFAPGRFNPQSVEGQRLLAHELTHVMQKGRRNLDVRTAEGEALHSEHSYGDGPQMQSLDLRQPQPAFRLGDGEGLGNSSGVHTAKRTRSKGHESGGKDTAAPDGEELIEQISGRVYELLMEELEHAFESR